MQTMSAPVKIFLWLVLIACMAVLVKNILFKGSREFDQRHIKRAFTKSGVKKRFATANLKPFATIKLFYNSRSLGTGYKMENLAGNVVGFIPLGLLFPLLLGFRRGWVAIGAVFLVSLGFELTQLFFSLGVFDVDDLILNTAGGIIGYIIYWIIRSIIRSRRKSETLVNAGS